MAKPIHRLPGRDRRIALEPMVGLDVILVEDLNRDGSLLIEHRGRLQAVAEASSGSLSGVAVLRKGGLRFSTAVSLATVRSCELDR